MRTFRSTTASRTLATLAAALVATAVGAPATNAASDPAASTPITTPGPTTPIPSGTKRTLTYVCTYPLIGDAPLSVDLRTDIPGTAIGDALSPGFHVYAGATATGNSYTGFALMGAKRIEGKITVDTDVIAPDGTTLPIKVPLAITPYTVPSFPEPIALEAFGTTPSIRFPSLGTASVAVRSFSMTLKLYKADGTLLIFPRSGTDIYDPETYGTVDVPCRLDPADQDRLIAAVTMVSSGSTTPGSTTPPATTPSTTPGLTTPGPGTVKYGYGIAGSATLAKLVKGSLPLRGAITANLTTATGAFTGDLDLDPTTGKLKALGFLPVTAQVAFVPTAPLTGTLTPGALTATAKVRIKLPKVSLLGLTLAGGGSCQTKQPSAIALRSTGAFAPLSGGTLAGTFAISDLTGCGALTGLVSSLTAGNGNVVSLSLTPAG